MADKDAKKPAAVDAAPKRGNKLGFFTTMIMVGLISPFIMPTLTLLFLGMFPTIIALVADNDRQKSSAIAIGSLNVAGVVPFVIDLWLKGQHWDTLIQILKEPSSWLVMLGAAGVGKMIVFAVPPVLAGFATIRYELRLKTLKDNLETIKATWGPDVGTTKPLSKVGQKE